jgi:hypothetical protein
MLRSAGDVRLRPGQVCPTSTYACTNIKCGIVPAAPPVVAPPTAAPPAAALPTAAPPSAASPEISAEVLSRLDSLDAHVRQLDTNVRQVMDMMSGVCAQLNVDHDRANSPSMSFSLSGSSIPSPVVTQLVMTVRF